VAVTKIITHQEKIKKLSEKGSIHRINLHEPKGLQKSMKYFTLPPRA